MIDSVIEKSKLLRLKAFAENLEQVIQQASQINWAALKIIDHLLDLELEARTRNSIALRFKQSKLSEKLTIDQFDFNFHTSRKKQKSRILDLMAMDFVSQKKTLSSSAIPVWERASWPSVSLMRQLRPTSRPSLPLPWISSIISLRLKPITAF